MTVAVLLRWIGVTLLAALAAVAYSTAGPLFHLHKVRIEGNGGWILRPETVRAGLSESGPMSLVFGDFGPLAAAVADSPLVRSATVRKDYPHEIVVEVETREPVARSATGGLVDLNGEWYAATSNQYLPVFAVTRRQLPQAVSFYGDAVERLAPLGLGINQLRHDGQGWLLFLSNGWVLQLGQRKLLDRMNRFVASWPQLRSQLATAPNLRFDLRYPQGMAVAGLRNLLEKKDG